MDPHRDWDSAFIVLGKFFGLVPAALACVFISGLGDNNSTFKGALSRGLRGGLRGRALSLRTEHIPPVISLVTDD